MCFSAVAVVGSVGYLYVRYVFGFFFFSSRRRHTRLQGDWSSDVCSSDLRAHLGPALAGGVEKAYSRRVLQEEHEQHEALPELLVTNPALPVAATPPPAEDRKSVV